MGGLDGPPKPPALRIPAKPGCSASGGSDDILTACEV
jgi:hypothetical protein